MKAPARWIVLAVIVGAVGASVYFWQQGAKDVSPPPVARPAAAPDAELEARSAGQKIMIRIGPGNSARVKAKLKDIRGALTSQAPQSPKS